MDNHDLNNNNSIFDGDTDNIENRNIEVNNNQSVENNVVKPVVDKIDLADKTINAVENFVDTKDHKNEYSPEELKVYKTQAAINYIPLVSLYYILSGKYKKSNYLFFHTNQGLNVTFVYAISFFIAKIISAIFSRDSLVLNSTPAVIEILCYTLYFLCFLLSLFGVVNTMNGNSKELPVIGKIKLLK